MSKIEAVMILWPNSLIGEIATYATPKPRSPTGKRLEGRRDVDSVSSPNSNKQKP